MSSHVYNPLSKAIGLTHHRPINLILGVIRDYCLRQDLLPLTAIVVSKPSKKPGSGFIAWDVDDLESGVNLVRNFNWSAIHNPFTYASNGDTAEDLVKRLVDNPGVAGDTYQLVRNRGSVQTIFRQMLTKIYDGQCAMCGLSFEEALDACHIVPWADASAQQRLDPTNGLFLCSVHHKLFDNGWITIGVSGKIYYSDHYASEGYYSGADRAATIELHEVAARLPRVPEHRPSREALKHHHERFKIALSE